MSGYNLKLSAIPYHQSSDIRPQHLYITNDEEIKEGNWRFDLKDNDFYKTTTSELGEIHNCKKIILTTDQDLIADGVQAIDDEFLEWFVSNPSCESVEVEKEYIFFNKDGYGDWYYNDYKLSDLPINYKIIITKQEPKQETLEKEAEWEPERMYSEEEMISFAEFVATYPDKNRNVYGEMLHSKSKYDGAERTIDLLEQFKKK
jgi:hypothetical protein